MESSNLLLFIPTEYVFERKNYQHGDPGAQREQTSSTDMPTPSAAAENHAQEKPESKGFIHTMKKFALKQRQNTKRSIGCHFQRIKYRTFVPYWRDGKSSRPLGLSLALISM
jgi:hypothetical protein